MKYIVTRCLAGFYLVEGGLSAMVADQLLLLLEPCPGYSRDFICTPLLFNGLEAPDIGADALQLQKKFDYRSALRNVFLNHKLKMQNKV